MYKLITYYATAHLDLSYLTPPETFTSNDVSEQGNLREDSDDFKSTHTTINKVIDGGNGAKGKEAKVKSGFSSDKIEVPQTAFDQLVLPSGHKDMVVSLITQHFRDKESLSKGSRDAQQVDIIRGKGTITMILQTITL